MRCAAPSSDTRFPVLWKIRGSLLLRVGDKRVRRAFLASEREPVPTTTIAREELVPNESDRPANQIEDHSAQSREKLATIRNLRELVIPSRDFPKKLSISLRRGKEGRIRVSTESNSVIYRSAGAADEESHFLQSRWFQTPAYRVTALHRGLTWIGLIFVWAWILGPHFSGGAVPQVGRVTVQISILIGLVASVMVLSLPFVIAGRRSPPVFTLELRSNLPGHGEILLYRSRGAGSESEFRSIRNGLREFLDCDVQHSFVERKYRRKDTTTK